MRPVNLLPEEYRPRRVVRNTNAANIALGVLGAMLVAMLAYVLTQNQINSRTGAIASTKQEAQVAEGQARQLAPFGTFAQTKQTREASVSQLANQRFDWERFMRELALVLPSGTSLLQMNGAASGDEEDAGSTPSAAPSASTTGPSVTFTGCAASQRRVAVLMVRLRRMYRATDVTLSDSTQVEGSAGGGTSASGAGVESGGDTSNCAPGRYRFEVAMTFAPEPQAQGGKSRKVPSALGGGS